MVYTAEPCGAGIRVGKPIENDESGIMMTKDSIPAELQQIREQIDAVDSELLASLARRFELTREVGKLKASLSLQSLDADREARKLAELETHCQQNGLNPALIRELFQRIMEEVRANHDRIRQSGSE